MRSACRERLGIVVVPLDEPYCEWPEPAALHWRNLAVLATSRGKLKGRERDPSTWQGLSPRLEQISSSSFFVPGESRLEIVDDLVALATQLANMRGLIAIDGVHGVGKSTLARALAQRLGCEAIAADDFLQRNRGLYVDAILIDDLRGRLNATLASVSAVILEGVCARAVVERLGLTATAFVYVKRLTPAGVPSDWQILDAENGEVAEPFYFSDLDREILHYHARYRPSTRADILFLRTEQM